MDRIDGEIRLSPKERERLHLCPNCSGSEFRTVLAEREASKNHPMAKFRKGRPIVQCIKCGFWTDLFGDQCCWCSGEGLRE